MLASSFLFVFQGLLKMKLLPRLRYILEVVRPPPRVVQNVLEVLTRIARHSSSSAAQVRTATLTNPRAHTPLIAETLVVCHAARCWIVLV